MGSGKGIPLLGGGRRDFLPGLLFVKGWRLAGRKLRRHGDKRSKFTLSLWGKNKNAREEMKG